MTSFTDSGNCFDLAGDYLKFLDEPYIIDSRLKEYQCNWNFQGDTRRDFEMWCKYSGLRCGGSPYYVGFDSVWYNGEYMPAPRAAHLRREDFRRDSIDSFNAALAEKQRRRADSLQNLPPLPLKRVSIEYLELGRATADYLGFSYSDYVGRARFFDYEDLFSVTIQAKNLGDTSFVYRTYSSVYDSVLTVFWGGTRERLTTSNVTATGVVSNSYQMDSFGLTFRLDGLKYYYEHSTDYEHKISGSGLLVYGLNKIFGSYQYTSTVVSSVPFLSSIPVVGAVFRHSADVVEERYIFITVNLKNALEGL